eukprot:3543858-Prorocentrum_lima.AAC.1
MADWCSPGHQLEAATDQGRDEWPATLEANGYEKGSHGTMFCTLPCILCTSVLLPSDSEFS